MASPYSMDLRQKILEAYDRKEGSQRTLAKRFHVSRTFLQTLLKLRNQTGSLAHKPMGGNHLPRLTKKDLLLIQEMFEANPDAYLRELCDWLFEKTKKRVSISIMHRAFKTLGIRRKKNN